jgi:hypothetical protein
MFYIPAAGRASAANKLDTRQQYLLVTKVFVTGFSITLLPDISGRPVGTIAQALRLLGRNSNLINDHQLDNFEINEAIYNI